MVTSPTRQQGARNAALRSPGSRRIPAGGMTEPNRVARVGAAFARRRTASATPAPASQDASATSAATPATEAAAPAGQDAAAASAPAPDTETNGAGPATAPATRGAPAAAPGWS